MNADARNINRLYRRQAQKFESWTNDLLACAYLLWRVQQIDEAKFEGWLADFCPDIPPELAREMIRQLHETTPGKQLLAELNH